MIVNKGGFMIDKKAFVERRQVIRYVQDGVFLSDLTLTALILTLLKNEANCFQAVPDHRVDATVYRWGCLDHKRIGNRCS